MSFHTDAEAIRQVLEPYFEVKEIDEVSRDWQRLFIFQGLMRDCSFPSTSSHLRCESTLSQWIQTISASRSLQSLLEEAKDLSRERHIYLFSRGHWHKLYISGERLSILPDAIVTEECRSGDVFAQIGRWEVINEVELEAWIKPAIVAKEIEQEIQRECGQVHLLTPVPLCQEDLILRLKEGLIASKKCLYTLMTLTSYPLSISTAVGDASQP